MHLEEFSEGNSFLHKADPRLKIIVFSIFSILCATAHGLKTPALFLIYSVFSIFIAHLKLRKLFSRLFIANFFIFFIWIFLPISYPGNPYIELWQIKISHEGFIYALSITIKANAIIVATITLLGTSSVNSLAHAMLHLKAPKKLVTVFFLFYRYITVIHDEYLKIKRTVYARGFVPKSNLHTYRTYAYIVGGMLIKSYEKAEEIYKAMLCRGFQGFFPLFEHFQTRKIDIIFSVLSIFIFILFWFKT
ncbi:Transmembrane component NikQ of energizing module of nickel ECF transporter [Thermodesulfovibrio sp. N1]|uniref:cobalt ECF transporter T component CbiQ n=1 Tax=unclassified Thermodesulfovibrio TaxID=2645936 RepID=UPI00083A7E6F|nr:MULTISPECIES: cobalt ECF transporter T component CbiQ [unclassified Thermodesulfovibrio]MDI1472173.1 cobalt ECF transporter T component CbiQ [Thermodesulfovibrio sp. 1176]ODA45078.1 Transmembrane component NikQ of energizing module of nickel ECF transporter [Thermodesulfovibrio sp. N1]